ncbi:MAG: hypothetical protein LBO81_07290 [Clostridiales Family XIII bacterium]|jgi:hypothetical protein|nr:hypothetical protein [Clostridiales Family XIII bacterium]
MKTICNKNGLGARGSLAVETAIFLPLFIIGVLTLGYLIKIVSVQENVLHTVTDETRLLAAEANVPVLSATFKKDLTARLDRENEDDIRNVEVSPIRYRMPYYGLSGGRMYTDLIGVSVHYTIDIKLPPVFKDLVEVENTALCRAFVGKDNAADIMPFDEMEREGDGSVVWVFPRSGERYHGADCPYIKNEPKEVMLNSALRSRYRPCELCKPGETSDGNLVYRFSDSGEAYHMGDCFLVERYVVSVSKSDAEADGYTACSKCGGG